MKGRIFSLEEFSLYDGPGIRTTVFFKGCPLRCIWCHSPEGLLFEKQIIKSPNGCLNCGACACLNENCLLCGNCIKSCPKNLIRISGIDYTPQELFDILVKNINILNMNNGGITFSGGEPFLQYRFLNEIIDLLYGKTHLAIQTSGYVATEIFIKTALKVDLILFDLKIMNQEKALKYQGVDNRQIHNNLEQLKRLDLPFIARVPLIPGITDTEENINEIIKALIDAKNLQIIELLPYNKLAGSKYKMLGRKYNPGFDEMQPVNPHLDLFRKYNLKVRVV